jgi:uncharacterized membrane protein
LGYAGIIYAAIIGSRNKRDVATGFSLGKFRQPIQIMAIIWTLIVVSALTFPATKIPGLDETHLPAKSTFIAIILGIVIYFGIIQKRIIKGEAGPPDKKS